MAIIVTHIIVYKWNFVDTLWADSYTYITRRRPRIRREATRSTLLVLLRTRRLGKRVVVAVSTDRIPFRLISSCPSVLRLPLQNRTRRAYSVGSGIGTVTGEKSTARKIPENVKRGYTQAIYRAADHYRSARLQRAESIVRSIPLPAPISVSACGI